MNPKVHILVPVHNRVHVTAHFLEQLSLQTYSNFHLVVVDDGSTDGTLDLVQEKMPQATVIRGSGSLWWAGCLQKGYEWIKKNCRNPDDVVLIINDDTYFGPEFLAKGVEALFGKRRTLLCARCYGYQSKQPTDTGIVWNWSTGGMRIAQNDDEINCFSTRGLFLRVGDFIELGGFHPILVPHYLSDYEFTMRAYNRGFRMMTHPEVHVATDESPGGIAEYDRLNLGKFFRQYFSKKNYRHPVYVFFFIYFACPTWRWKIKNWLALGREVKQVFQSLRPKPVRNLIKIIKFFRSARYSVIHKITQSQGN